MRLVLLILPLALLIPDTVFAADGTLVSEIVNEFHKNLSKYEQVMLKYAKILFYWCAVLEVAWLGIKASLGTAQIKESIKDFCMVLLAAGFFLAVINNYHTWTWNIINGLKAIAGEATSLYDAADKPFTVGLELAKTVFAKTSYTSPFDSITYVLAGMAILICFALITMQVILIKCECIVAVCAAAILLGLGASAFFRDYAINTIKFIVSVAFKLMTMYLLLGVGIGFLSQLQIADNNWLQIGVTISFCIIFYCLVQTLPQTVAGIITGSHSGNGGGGFAMGLKGVALGAGAYALGAASTAASNAASGARNVGLAAQSAYQQGGGGMSGVMHAARHTASNLATAYRAARAESAAQNTPSNTTTTGQLQNQTALHKALNEEAKKMMQ